MNHIKGLNLPFEFKSNNSTLSALQKTTKYVNSYPRLNKEFSKNVMMEEEKLKPDIISFGERFLTVSNEIFNQQLIKYLRQQEKMLRNFTDENTKMRQNN